MKMILNLILLLFFWSFGTCKQEQQKLSFISDKESVYICGKTGASRYHYSQSCRGLRSCEHEIVKTTRKKAESIGLTLCGWED